MSATRSFFMRLPMTLRAYSNGLSDVLATPAAAQSCDTARPLGRYGLGDSARRRGEPSQEIGAGQLFREPPQAKGGFGSPGVGAGLGGPAEPPIVGRDR